MSILDPARVGSPARGRDLRQSLPWAQPASRLTPSLCSMHQEGTHRDRLTDTKSQHTRLMEGPLGCPQPDPHTPPLGTATSALVGVPARPCRLGPQFTLCVKGVSENAAQKGCPLSLPMRVCGQKALTEVQEQPPLTHSTQTSPETLFSHHLDTANKIKHSWTQVHGHRWV